MRYRIAIHQSEEGFSISVPGLPGCWSQGATDVEAVENIKDERKKNRDILLSVDGRTWTRALGSSVASSISSVYSLR